MENSNLIEIRLKSLTYILIVGFAIIILLIAGLYIKIGSVNEINTEKETEVAYDTSKMKEINGSSAAKLFDKTGTHFIYIGRSSCGVCVSLVPELNKVIDDLKIELNYLVLNSTFQTDFADLFPKLTIETKVNTQEGEVKGTYGELLEEYGFTPIVIIIKDGKMVDGFIGYEDKTTIKTLFKKYI